MLMSLVNHSCSLGVVELLEYAPPSHAEEDVELFTQSRARHADQQVGVALTRILVLVV